MIGAHWADYSISFKSINAYVMIYDYLSVDSSSRGRPHSHSRRDRSALCQVSLVLLQKKCCLKECNPDFPPFGTNIVVHSVHVLMFARWGVLSPMVALQHLLLWAGFGTIALFWPVSPEGRQQYSAFPALCAPVRGSVWDWVSTATWRSEHRNAIVPPSSLWPDQSHMQMAHILINRPMHIQTVMTQ